MLRQLHRIDIGAGGAIGIPEQITNSQTRDQYYVKSLIQEAITSSQLEGAVTTRELAKEMIQSGRKPIDRSEKMVLNNFITMRRISHIKDKPLDQDLLFELHDLITRETLDDPSAAGRFRKESEEVHVYDEEDQQVLYKPPPAKELKDRLEILYEFANKKDGDAGSQFIHPVVRAIIVHFWVAYEHPFVDGNGRSARAFFYWAMLYYKYWLFEYVSISGILLDAPKRYARSFLYTETDENDLTYFIEYQIEVIDRAVESLHRYIEKKVKETREFEQQLKGLSSLNHRQRALVMHAIKHPFQDYTFDSHKLSHAISHQTSRTDIIELEDKSLLKRSKRGNKYIFQAVNDLSKRLGYLK
jgi:Fic family protein